MFESTTPGQMQGTVHAAAVAKVAREARWSLDSPRSYLVPSLFWFASGHGRIQIDSQRSLEARNSSVVRQRGDGLIEQALRFVQASSANQLAGGFEPRVCITAAARVRDKKSTSSA